MKTKYGDRFPLDTVYVHNNGRVHVYVCRAGEYKGQVRAGEAT